MMKFLALVHPAAVARGQFGLEAAQVTYLKRLRALLDGRLPWPAVSMDVTQPQPGARCWPKTIEEIRLWFSNHQLHAPKDGDDDLLPGCPIKPHGLYAADIEHAGPHLRCIGFACWKCEAYLQVPFRRQGGVVYWPSYLDLCAVVEFLDTLFADPQVGLIWQNGQHDVEELETIGFTPEPSYVADTMHMQRHAFAEAPASLQYMGITYGRMPAWKRLVAEDEEGADAK